jgi:DNA gyrase subunit A
LAELYKLTPLQSTFSISLLALVDGEPHLLSLKRLLLHFLEHRREVIRRRSEYDLAKALVRKEILEGLLRALDILDEVIALIRRSRTADVARQGLINEFKFTELQAQAILDMQLRRLAALERKKLQDEYKEVVALIKELGELLESPKKLLALIRKNLVDLKATYADPRRTQIADRVKGALTTMDVLPDQEVWVALGADGVLSRRPYEAITATGLKRTPAGAGAALIAANTRHDLYLLSARGQATRVAIHQIPEGGAHFADLSGLTRRDRVVAMHAVPKSQPDAPLEGHLVMATAQGQVKRVRLPDLSDQAHANPQVFNLDEKDELVWADVSRAGSEVLLATAQGQMIRFPEEEVRAAGLPAGGVAGIKVQKRDRVVGGMLLPAGTGAEARLAVVTALGWGKQTPLAEFPVHGRGGQGVQAGRFSERTGALAGIALLGEDEALLCFTEGGAGRLVRSGEVPVASRATLGKALFAATVGATVRAVMAVAAGEPESTKPGEPRSQPAKAQGNARAVQPSLLPEDGAAAKPRRTRTAGKQPEPAAPTSAPKTPARKTAAKAAAAVAVSATVVKAATAEKPQPPPASRAKAGTTAPKAATGKSKPPAAEAPPPKPAAARSKPAAADAAIPAPKAGGAPSKPAAASKAEAAPSKPAAAPKAATAGAKTSAAPEAAPASPAKTGKAKEAPAKQPDAPPKPATRAKSAPEAGASGARVFDRSDLPRVMPAPKAQKDAAPAPPPEPGSTGKPAAKKKPVKPEA